LYEVEVNVAKTVLEPENFKMYSSMGMVVTIAGKILKDEHTGIKTFLINLLY
jgi:hypothetical protein